MPQKDNNITTIIFDIGGVLFLTKDRKKRNSQNLLTSYKEVCTLLTDIPLTHDEFYNRTVETYRNSSKGAISKKETLEQLSKILKIPPSNVESRFQRVYESNIIENKQLYTFLLKLKSEGYKLGTLTIQWYLSKDAQIPKRYYSLFDAMVVSCDDKVRKPSPESYKLILKRLKTAPQHAIFVDDKEENTQGAMEIGMKAIHYKNNKQFYRDLKKLTKEGY